ncbi:hypothetical protein D5H75_28265 [Bailinhaonella thermotolerans]|uniref:Uncharacterized protein n=1 Tax=Bailinhaonella thermotolerans TaxID=1070861 RepID=A0A3A4A6Y6_9ACTN|nr:hypothetical protein D5H75_28265 [Bailinhaonella thermotolerans]
MLVIVGAVLAFFVFGRDGGGGVAQGSPSPSASQALPPQSPGPQQEERRPVASDYLGSSSDYFSRLEDRSADPEPLTEDEVFDDEARKPSFQNFHLELKGTRNETDCGKAVWGDALRELLADGGCSQVLNGYYVDRSGGYVAQVWLFNMKDKTWGDRLVAGMDPDPGPTAKAPGKLGFVIPMRGPAPYDRMLEGETWAHAEAFSHYVLLSWVGRADNNNIHSSEDMIALSTTAERCRGFIFSRNNR